MWAAFSEVGVFLYLLYLLFLYSCRPFYISCFLSSCRFFSIFFAFLKPLAEPAPRFGSELSECWLATRA